MVNFDFLKKDLGIVSFILPCFIYDFSTKIFLVQFCPHIETSQLICCADQFTGFYMRAAVALNGLIKSFF